MLFSERSMYGWYGRGRRNRLRHMAVAPAPLKGREIATRLYLGADSAACKPGLAMSRSLGDVTAHGVGVSAKPERLQYTVLPHDEFVVFGSDGVWQVMTDQEVVDFVSLYMNGRDDTHTCADALTLHAQDMWKSKMDEVRPPQAALS
eukprot:scaffold17689_cov35-Prasinocladus_malaysianus.AAC.1